MAKTKAFLIRKSAILFRESIAGKAADQCTLAAKTNMKSLPFPFLALLLISLSAFGQADDLARQGLWYATLRYADPGIEVRSVTAGKAADRSGLKTGDRILKINGRSIADRISYSKLRRSLKAGKPATLLVQRARKTLELEISLDPYPRENTPGLDTQYGSLVTGHGDRVRTITTKPAGATGKLPAILFIQWLSCGPPEQHWRFRDGWAAMAQEISRAGFLFQRVTKPGVGDSEGPDCADYGFNYELETYRSALQHLKTLPDVDTSRIFLFGGSMGGSMAPIIAQKQNLKGIIVSGCYAKTWYEHMLEIERRISELSGDNAEETNVKMKAWSEFYSLYLNEKMTPAEIFKIHPHLQKFWPEPPAHQYGRPVHFYMEANEHNIAAYWEKLELPVLVIYGEHDWIMSREDHQMIADIMNKKQPGLGTYLEIPGMDHQFVIYPSRQKAFDGFSDQFDPEVARQAVEWLNKTAQ